MDFNRILICCYSHAIWLCEYRQNNSDKVKVTTLGASVQWAVAEELVCRQKNRIIEDMFSLSKEPVEIVKNIATLTSDEFFYDDHLEYSFLVKAVKGFVDGEIGTHVYVCRHTVNGVTSNVLRVFATKREATEWLAGQLVGILKDFEECGEEHYTVSHKQHSFDVSTPDGRLNEGAWLEEVEVS